MDNIENKINETENKLKKAYMNHLQDLRNIMNERCDLLTEKNTAHNKLINAVHEKNELLQSKLNTYDNSISLVLNNNVLGHILKDMLKNEDVQTRIKTWITEDITNRQDELMRAVQELRTEGVTDLLERIEELENMDYVYDNESGIENVIDNYINYNCDYVEESDIENMINDAVDEAVIDEAIQHQLEKERKHTHDYN